MGVWRSDAHHLVPVCDADVGVRCVAIYLFMLPCIIKLLEYRQVELATDYLAGFQE
jgi:hypothetical protein